MKRQLIWGGLALAACANDSPTSSRGNAEEGRADARVDAGTADTEQQSTGVTAPRMDSGPSTSHQSTDDEPGPDSSAENSDAAIDVTEPGDPSADDSSADDVTSSAGVETLDASLHPSSGLDAGVPPVSTDASNAELDAGEGQAIAWTDVTPTWTRVGPQTPPRTVFSSEEQLGGFWETASGDVLTSFRTSVTQPQEGIAIYDWHYTLQTIVGDTVQPVPETDAGTCRYEDWPYGSCAPGPDPHETLSLATSDGTLLVVREQSVGGATVHPVVEALDPVTGELSPIIELTEVALPMSGSYSASYTLRQLADGTVALSTSRPDAAPRTAVFNTLGEHLAERDGFMFGQRWQNFALFVGENSRAYNRRFDWWDPRTGAQVRAFGFPEPEGAEPAFRTFVTPVGNVVFPGFTYTDRLIQIDEEGSVVEDRETPAWGFHGTLPDGRYLAIEDDAALGYVLRVYDRSGASTDIYDEATLIQDANWPPFGTDVSGTYPHIAPLEFSTVIDDSGTAYVGFVLQTGGERSETYLAAFASDGQKLWGLELQPTGIGSCGPERVLSGRRLVVRCFGRYLRRFLILGE